MRNATDIRHGRHCVYNLHVHLVFVTKYRKIVFTKSILDDMREIMGNVCLEFEGELLELDGERDHVHLLVSYPPKASIAKLVNSLKGVSSRVLRQKHKDLLKSFYKPVLWSPSYCAISCGGAPLEIIKQYIQQQDTPKD